MTTSTSFWPSRGTATPLPSQPSRARTGAAATRQLDTPTAPSSTHRATRCQRHQAVHARLAPLLPAQAMRLTAVCTATRPPTQQASSPLPLRLCRRGPTEGGRLGSCSMRPGTKCRQPSPNHPARRTRSRMLNSRGHPGVWIRGPSHHEMVAAANSPSVRGYDSPAMAMA